MELGLYTFGDRTLDPELGRPPTAEERLRRLLEEAELAEETGLALFAVGEHHREDYAVSAPAVVLSAIAAHTRRIRLASAVVVLSSDDPVRVFQQFATLDLLSGGRAELWVGRGSFVESFPLFGYDLRDYEALFEEKLALLLKIREAERVYWPGGRFTQPIPGLGVYPRPKQNPLPLFVAAGGSPESAVRAGRLGLPLVLAVIAGSPKRFLPFVALYRKTAQEHGHTPRLTLAAHGFVAEEDGEAFRLAAPAFLAVMNRIGRERGWQPLTQEYFAWSRGLEGADFIGDPLRVAEKALYWYELFRPERLVLQLTVGTLPHAKVLRAIELLGGEVLPRVQRALATPPAAG
ncbi:luciferase [Thermus sp. LT1-2-5]|uniref:LLM class flavin-dependent oxidoreductase n=1 Tax=Thermus sp. LT1-2-5 TaxID=3026935 RepID=UPI0030E77D15